MATDGEIVVSMTKRKVKIRGVKRPGKGKKRKLGGQKKLDHCAQIL